MKILNYLREHELGVRVNALLIYALASFGIIPMIWFDWWPSMTLGYKIFWLSTLALNILPIPLYWWLKRRKSHIDYLKQKITEGDNARQSMKIILDAKQ